MQKVSHPLPCWIKPVLPYGLLSIILNHTVRLPQILKYLLPRRRHGQTVLKFSCIVHVGEEHSAARQGKPEHETNQCSLHGAFPVAVWNAEGFLKVGCVHVSHKRLVIRRRESQPDVTGTLDRFQIECLALRAWKIAVAS